MIRRRHRKLFHLGEYAAEVEVELIEMDCAYKLDEFHEALRQGDLSTASRLACVFTLTPVTF